MKNLPLSILSTVALSVLAVAVSSCVVGTDEADEIPDNPETLQVNSVTYGKWVSVTIDFGPCGELPATCTVGDQVSAHSGPGTAGGCFIYECKQIGTWVSVTVDFGPCGVLPATCTVGDQVSAHSGPGTAGGCFIYQCK